MRETTTRLTTTLKAAITTLAALALLAACGGGGGGGGGGDGGNTISTADVDALTQAIAIAVGDVPAVLTAGELPASSDDAEAPVAESTTETVQIRAGETANISIIATTNTVLSALFGKIPGAQDYFEATLDAGSGKVKTVDGKTEITLNIAVTLPANVEDGTFCFDIKVQDDANRVSNTAQTCVEVGEPEAKFTTEFLSGRAFYLDVIDASTGSEDTVGQWVFNADNSGSVRFGPSEDNDFTTDDINSIEWAVTSEGLLQYTEIGPDEPTVITVTPTVVDTDSASFTCTVEVAGATIFTCAESTMTAASQSLYGFLSGRAFSVDLSTDSDLERLTFDPDGTGTIQFAPNPDNDFNPNDVSTIHWEAVSDSRVEFTEFGGDGYDRNETGCEENAQIECDLDNYNWVFTFDSITDDSATFSWTVDYIELDEDGSVEESGSASGMGSIQADS